jgi:hypothetical protein
MTNGEIGTFTKSGLNRWRDEIENSFGFWGELGTDNFVFDPEVKWDPHSRRFFAMACERSDNWRSNFLLAVSKDESPDDRDDWYKYRLDVTSLAGNDIDSPNLSMSTDYVLLTADFFGPDKYLVYILYKETLLNGGNPVEASELISGSGQQSMGIPVVYDNDDKLYILQSTEYSNNTEVIHLPRDLGSVHLLFARNLHAHGSRLPISGLAAAAGILEPPDALRTEVLVGRAPERVDVGGSPCEFIENSRAMV